MLVHGEVMVLGEKKTKWKTSGTASWWQAGQNRIVLMEERAIRHCLSVHSSTAPRASSPSVIPSQPLTFAQVGYFGCKGGGPEYGTSYPQCYSFPSPLDPMICHPPPQHSTDYTLFFSRETPYINFKSKVKDLVWVVHRGAQGICAFGCNVILALQNAGFWK